MLARCGALCLLVASLVTACGGRTPGKIEEPADAGTDADADAGPEPITVTDKLDVLFVVDNSETGGLSHAALSGTIAYFLDRLVNPRCVNGLGQIVDQPASLNEPCQVGKRDFAPLADVQLAVISTSIGGHGADTCSPASSSFTPEQNDQAHLLTRNPAGGVVPSYAGKGFLAWDPNGKRSPVGDADLDTLEAKLRQIVDGVGSHGCGFEAQLESFYRFLIDPDPYQDVVIQGGSALLMGTDNVLLQQRADFLRPDSALLIVLVSDEDDCSTRDGGQFFYSNQTLTADNASYHLPRAHDVCATDPNNACCVSCGQATPAGCPPSPACSEPGFSDTDDPINLRCFDQKRRFGIDFLFPIDRYLNGLTEPQVADRNGNVVGNPLFVGNRDPSLVMVAGIVGVLWQDIAISSSGLGAGLLPSTEIPWSRVLETDGQPPTDPLMIASRDPRSGSNPVTGDAIAPPESLSPTANPINGHEHHLTNDLQYACIFQLETPLDCTTEGCGCSTADATELNPLCQDPTTGSYDDIQRYGRALPARRLLLLLQGLGARAIVGSVCTAADFNPGSDAYAFKPATQAIMRELRRHVTPYPEPSDGAGGSGGGGP